MRWSLHIEYIHCIAVLYFTVQLYITVKGPTYIDKKNPLYSGLNTFFTYVYNNKCKKFGINLKAVQYPLL